MDSLKSLYHQLYTQFSAHRPELASASVSAFHASVTGSPNLLGWLKAQTAYPQFYFRLRDEAKAWAATGEVRRFTDLKPAQDFMQSEGLPLAGGLTFNRQSRFFLPRLLLQQNDNELSATLFFDNRAVAENERNAVENAFKTFTKMTALSPVRQIVKEAGMPADRPLWCDWAERALSCIRQGDLRKVVLANQFRFEADTAVEALDLLAESENKNTGCYHFLFAERAERVFLGSTPERLYRRRHAELETEALAGTASTSDDDAQNRALGEWLLHDEKNRYENQLVADGICQHLTPFCTHLEIAPLSLKPLRQVQHLCRTISAGLAPGYGDGHCLAAIHPTAAVAGFPQQTAMRFLQNTENFDRTWYAGTLGVMQPEQAEFCVTIRSAVIEGNKIAVFAGAGIVEGSVPLLEWREIKRKAAGLISLLKTKKEETEH